MAFENKKVFTERKDYPFSTLREMVTDGDIIPNPEYQRDYVYSYAQAFYLGFLFQLYIYVRKSTTHIQLLTDNKELLLS